MNAPVGLFWLNQLNKTIGRRRVACEFQTMGLGSIAFIVSLLQDVWSMRQAVLVGPVTRRGKGNPSRMEFE